MSTTLAPTPSALVLAPAPAIRVAKGAKTWLVGPWFDLLFIANIAWPLIVLLTITFSIDTADPLNLFVMYFISTPHRWITLVLVFGDSDRIGKEPAKFGGLALGLVALGLVLVGIAAILPRLAVAMGIADTLPYLADSLDLLMMLDYVWNAWHFAAQHAGIARIYGRMTRPQQLLQHAEFEKTAIRTLVLWVFFRLAVCLAASSAYGQGVRWLGPWLEWIDPVVMILPIILLVREIRAYRPECRGRLLYMASVIALYGAQLVAIRMENGLAMRALFLAGAVFHAVEYLAICNWSVQKKTTGVWRHQLTRTGVAMLVFMGVLGITNWVIALHSQYLWALVTLLVSLLHYAYDGIIWRARPAVKASAA
jgi:hypothetical protein